MALVMDERGFPDETLDVLFDVDFSDAAFPTSGHAARARAVNVQIRELAGALRDNLVVAADRTYIMRKLREIRLMAHDAIRLEESRR